MPLDEYWYEPHERFRDMMRVCIVLLAVLFGCGKKSNPPAPYVLYGSASRWDTMYDTLRYFVPVPIEKPETVITERAKVILRLDTVRRVIQVGQVVKTPVAVRETTRVVVQQVVEAPRRAERRTWGFWTFLIIFAVCTVGLWLAWKLLIRR